MSKSDWSGGSHDSTVLTDWLLSNGTAHPIDLRWPAFQWRTLHRVYLSFAGTVLHKNVDFEGAKNGHQHRQLSKTFFWAQTLFV